MKKNFSLFLIIYHCFLFGQAEDQLKKGFIAYNSNRDTILAEQYFQKAKMLEPDNAQVFFRIAQFRMVRWPNYYKSLSEFKKVIQLDPSHWEAYYECGKINYWLDNYNEAINYFDIYIQKNPSGSSLESVLQLRGNCNLELKNYQESMKDFNTVIKIRKYPSIMYDRALLKYELGDSRGAISDLNEAIDIHPREYEKGYFFRGDIFFEIHQFKKAIEDYSKVISINPNDPLAYFNRGLSKLLDDQLESGCLDLSKAGELGYMKAFDIIKKYCK